MNQNETANLQDWLDSFLQETSKNFRTKTPETYLARLSKFLGQNFQQSEIQKIFTQASRDLDHFPSIAQVMEIARQLEVGGSKWRYAPNNFCRTCGGAGFFIVENPHTNARSAAACVVCQTGKSLASEKPIQAGGKMATIDRAIEAGFSVSKKISPPEDVDAYKFPWPEKVKGLMYTIEDNLKSGSDKGYAYALRYLGITEDDSWKLFEVWKAKDYENESALELIKTKVKKDPFSIRQIAQSIAACPI